MDNMVPLLLCALLCISAFSAADGKPSCFSHDRSRTRGQYVNQLQCTCTEARQRALDRGDVFVPKCKENGKFARKQTGPDVVPIFCVDEDFKYVGFGPDCQPRQ